MGIPPTLPDGDRGRTDDGWWRSRRRRRGRDVWSFGEGTTPERSLPTTLSFTVSLSLTRRSTPVKGTQVYHRVGRPDRARTKGTTYEIPTGSARDGRLGTDRPESQETRETGDYEVGKDGGSDTHLVPTKPPPESPVPYLQQTSPPRYTLNK